MTPTPAAPAAMTEREQWLAKPCLVCGMSYEAGEHFGPSRETPSHFWQPTDDAFEVREIVRLRAEIDRLRAATTASCRLATALHRALQQDADSGDFGRGLDDRVTLAADLRLKLEMHTEPAP